MSSIINEPQLDFDDVLIRPTFSTINSRKNVVLEREFKFYHSPQTWSGIPVIISNMANVGCLDMALVAQEYKIITCLHKHYSLEETIDIYSNLDIDLDYVWFSFGMRDEDRKKFKEFILWIDDTCSPPPNICLDVPNGYLSEFVKWCADVRELSPQSIIMAGNVVTSEAAANLILNGGVDIVKVGIGSNRNFCTTRNVSGVGRPQFSAVQDVTNILHGLTSGPKKLGLVCSDGGCYNSGDFAKAYGIGSDFVMAGSFFGGANECAGEWKYVCRDNMDVKSQLKMYGMSSEHAQEVHGNGMATYKSAEGEVRWVDCKGPVSGIIEQLLGGLRSTCTYVNSPSLKDLSKCTTFYKVNRIK